MSVLSTLTQHGTENASHCSKMRNRECAGKKKERKLSLFINDMTACIDNPIACHTHTLLKIM